jgi:hypothetical protein
MPGSRVRWWVALLAVWLVSAAYVGPRTDRGWIPSDEGVVGHSAERVLAGEMPHRDFDDLYTGGLSEADAIVYRWTSVRLVNLRWALYGVFVLWVPVVFYIASRFARPTVAAVATLLCVVWSIPTYPAAMASWYNLFFATIGTAGLIRFTETARRRWIVYAGILGGLSILVKVVGLYYIAGALLFFVWHEYQVAHGRAQTAGARPNRWYAIFVAAALALFVLMLVRLVAVLPSHSRFLHFVLPGTLLAAFLGQMEWTRPPSVSSAMRFRSLAVLVGPFLLGVALPIALFLVPYVAAHAVGDLVHGVFVTPTRRTLYAVALPVPLKTIWSAALWFVVFVPSRRRVERYGVLARNAWIVLAVAAGLALVATAHGGLVYADLWLAIRYIAPATVVAGGFLLWRLNRAPLDSSRRQEQIWLLVCMTALCSLVQVPYAGSVYILYFAPIAILALLAIVTSREGGAGPRPAIAAAFFLAFGVMRVNPGHISVVGRYAPQNEWPTVALPIARTGLWSSPIASLRYTQVTELLRDHSAPGGYTYAAPDCPELYYLSQLHNPTRTLFDFLDDPRGHDSRVLRAIDSHRVTAIALNSTPFFSAPIDSALADSLRARFPDSAVVDNFVVRWRSR